MPYLLGGSLAAAVWGEPRSTLDVDFVISLELKRITALSKELEKRAVLIPADIMLSQLEESRGDLAIVGYHLSAGFKAELFPLRAGDELRASALARRIRVELEPPLGAIYVHAPEDLILYKLQYFDLSAQTKHTRDIVSILLSRGSMLDYSYLLNWIGQLGLTASWQHMTGEARRLGAAIPPES
ncbi:MAG: hypothetical protein KA764_05890 [Anaerolineales bacterium]|nr:hypothetical protein [Anaerolineales bacterium]